jgi:preprotein translocase subunit YajC
MTEPKPEVRPKPATVQPNQVIMTPGGLLASVEAVSATEVTVRLDDETVETVPIADLHSSFVQVVGGTGDAQAQQA